MTTTPTAPPGAGLRILLLSLAIADDIGADGYAQDAGEVITLVKSLLANSELLTCPKI